jgi:hypothetical protein
MPKYTDFTKSTSSKNSKSQSVKDAVSNNSPNDLPPRRRKSPDYLMWLQEAYNTARGETALWVAVITQAMMDALSRCKKTESLYQKHEAICWLTSNNKDFIDVCLAAGMNPDYVRLKAKKVLVAPVPWRAEAGQGKRYQERKKYREKQRLKEKETKVEVNTQPNVISMNFLIK